MKKRKKPSPTPEVREKKPAPKVKRKKAFAKPKAPKPRPNKPVKPKPKAPKPKPVKPKPKPVKAKPKPKHVKAKPKHVKPKPAKPKPRPKPPAARPKPPAPRPKQPRPKPVKVKPKRPKPRPAPRPKPPAPKPKPKPTKPKPKPRPTPKPQLTPPPKGFGATVVTEALKPKLKLRPAPPLPPAPPSPPKPPEPPTRERLLEILREAIVESLKDGEIKEHDTRKRSFKTDMNEGSQRGIRVGVIVNEENVEDIYYWIDRKIKNWGGRYPIWMATFIYSSLGEKVFGSGTLARVLKSGIRFQAQGFDTTGVWRTKTAMMMAVRDWLERKADDPTTTILLRYVLVRNFRRRDYP